MPDFPIIDAHVHLYDLGRIAYGWLNGVPKIKRSHLPADFHLARGDVAVEKFVFVEVAADPGLHLAEAEWAAGLAEPRLAAIVAHAPLERGAAALADLERLAAMPKVRGIRRLIQGASDPGFCLEPEFLANVRLLPGYDFTFDICVKHFALVYGLELARLCPDTTFILDHIGKPDIRHGLRDPWWGQMRALAKLPNVACKLSGVVTEADHRAWKRSDLAPYVRHALDCFGFDRLMFASDWPVSSLTHDYAVWVDIVDEVLAGASDGERRKIFRDTASRVYRLAA